jgi:hypothetical protein
MPDQFSLAAGPQGVRMAPINDDRDDLAENTGSLLIVGP